MTADQELIKATKMIVDAFKGLKYTDTDIHSIINLCLNGWITDQGEFTAEYRKLALQAKEQDLTPQVITRYQ